MTTYGRGSSFGHGIESTWGSAVAISNWLSVFSCSIQESPENAPIPHLSTGQADYSDDYNPRVECVGDVEMPLLFEGCGLVLSALMGAVPSTTGSGPYVHTFERGTAHPGITVELVRGNSGNSEEFSGVVFPDGALVFERGELARFRSTLRGKQATGARSSAPNPSYGGTVKGRSMRGSQVGSVAFNGNTFVSQRIEVSLNNKLSRLEELGSLYTSQPGMDDYGEVRIRATIVHRNENLYTDFRALVQSNIVFAVTGAGNHLMTVTGRNARLTSVQAPISGAGIVTQEIEWLCFSDASNGALSIALRNDQATYNVN